MASPRVLILRAPGANCDAETAYAFEQVGAKSHALHVNQLIENPQLGKDYQILCIPGGFSYGDDIAAGRILAQRLQVHLRALVEEFCGNGRLTLGICNGFQVMMRLGIFFPGRESAPPATLAHNAQARFEDRWVHLSNHNSNSVFLNGIERMYLPIAHGEGRLAFSPDADDQQLLASGQLGLRYCAEVDGATAQSPDAMLPFPDNPNGAAFNVAGLSDPTGRIFGLMPHPGILTPHIIHFGLAANRSPSTATAASSSRTQLSSLRSYLCAPAESAKAVDWAANRVANEPR